MATANKMIGYRPDPLERGILEAYKDKTGLPFARVIAMALREKADREGVRPQPVGAPEPAQNGSGDETDLPDFDVETDEERALLAERYRQGRQNYRDGKGIPAADVYARAVAYIESAAAGSGA